MTEALEFIGKHRTTGALIDANVLLVYAMGSHDEACLQRYPHTKQYASSFGLFKLLIEMFPVIYTTPHILTEVSNLGGKLGPTFFATLRTVILSCEEQYRSSRDIIEEASFQKLGLTDAGIASLAKNQYVIITADWPLYRILRSKNIDAINVYHLMQLDWLSLLTA